MVEVGAVVLAAGVGTRFRPEAGSSKVLAPLGGRPLVRRVAETALASRARPVVVVLGHAADAVAAALAGLPVATILNDDYRAGVAGSLKVGLAALPAGIDGALVLLADMPTVTTSVLDRLIAAFEARAGAGACDAVVPVHADRSGNPVLLGRTMFAAVSTLVGDEGARRLLAQPARTIEYCRVDELGVVVDVDTRDALDDLDGLA